MLHVEDRAEYWIGLIRIIPDTVGFQHDFVVSCL